MMTDILMATYNGERYLQEQMESLLAQTCTDWHLTIRDDGSTDKTQDIIDHYLSAFPNKISQLNDGGSLGARDSFQMLLNASTADYVFFADQDDVWSPNKLERMLALMQETEAQCPKGTPLVLHCDLEVVDSTLNTIAPSFWAYSNLRPELLDNDIHFLAIANDVTGCAMLLNKAARELSLPFYEHAYMHDAWITLVVKANGGKVIPVHEALVRYRQHGNNTLGAKEYKFFNGGLRWKLFLAKRSYGQAHPLVFKNVMQFVYHKLRYFAALHL